MRIRNVLLMLCGAVLCGLLTQPGRALAADPFARTQVY